MATRTVRLDEESEAALDEIIRETGKPISWALKQGLLVFRAELMRPSARSAFEIYSELDLGPGGYASAASTDTRRAARDAIRKKHRR
ncbi:MAG: ribbon-helix-helix protein, CopG family [Deltaproteobacteria bacterium]|nr:ribbon-helix-helix protein, CopG family [Deltaproteobacteria bacterium]